MVWTIGLSARAIAGSMATTATRLITPAILRRVRWTVDRRGLVLVFIVCLQNGLVRAVQMRSRVGRSAPSPTREQLRAGTAK